jgi:hypothetical protein
MGSMLASAQVMRHRQIPVILIPAL